MRFNLKNKQAFSLLEIIVVIFIITIGLVGVLSLVIQNVQIGHINKNMLIASQLAQEGLELVRNVRDNNWIAGDDWERGDGADPNTDIIQDGNYSIDFLGIVDTDSIDDPEAQLYIDPDGFFRHYLTPGSATSTTFSRIIVADTDTSNASTTFQSIIQWRRGNNTHSYTAETVLYDWQ